MAPDYSNPTRQSEIELRDLVLSNPDEGFGRFLEIYTPVIRRVIARFGLKPEDRDELFQEISHALVRRDLHVFRKWDPKTCPLGSFIVVISTHTGINYVKSAFHKYSLRKIGEEGDAFPLIDQVETPAESARDRIDRIRRERSLHVTLRRLVEEEKLVEKDFQILNLRLRGLSFLEIAKILDMEPNAIRTRFHRVKPKLRTYLKEWDRRPDDGNE